MLPDAQGAKMGAHWLNPYGVTRDGKRKSKPAKSLEEIADPQEVCIRQPQRKLSCSALLNVAEE